MAEFSKTEMSIEKSKNAFIHLIENDFLNTNMHNPLIINLVSMGQRSCCKA